MSPILRAQKRVFLCLSLLCIGREAYCQTGTIKGLVTDSLLNDPIQHVNVIINDKQVITDPFGNFSITDLSPNNYNIRISHLGYKRYTQQVNLKDGDTISLTIPLRSTSINLSEVTTTDTRDIGQTMSVINQIDKVLRPTNSAQDLLRLVPGLFIAQHAGGGKAEQIFLRGFDCDHGTDFSVNIDGMPVNMVSHAHGQGYADFHFVIPETVDKLNVYKGPYATQYGDFATAGAGEFSTKNAIAKSMVKLEYGQFDTYRAMAMIDVLKGHHLLSKRHESAYIAGEYNYTNSYFDSKQHFFRYNIFGKYNGMLSEKTILNFSASTFNSGWDASGQIPNRGVSENIIDRYGSIDPTEGGTTGRTNANLLLTTGLKHGGIIKNRIYYSHYNFNLYSNFTFFLNDSINGDQIEQTEKGRSIYGYTGTYEKNTSIGTKHLKSVFGLGTRIDQGDLMLRHTVKRVVLDTIVGGSLYQQNASAYLDETLQLTKKLSVNAGLRFDYFDFSFHSIVNDSLSGKAQKSKVSPKLNFYYDATPSVQLFLHGGMGFHSNDARSVVLKRVDNSLPRAIGYEFGSTFKLGKRIIANAALWGLDMESELTYTGDDGTVEIKGPTRRLGVDLSLRYEITTYLFADIDLNYNHGRFTQLPEGENYIPLAPTLTSTGGLTIKRTRGINGSIRYRYIDSRPANENNSTTALGYFLLDALVNYTQEKYQFGISIENVLNTQWNQAQFDTESRLRGESQAVSELHYTPGTPFFVKGSIALFF